jgi:fibronectin type 3 domain-containing protein
LHTETTRIPKILTLRCTWQLKGQVGIYNSIGIDHQDNPHISYYDYDNGDLKYGNVTFTVPSVPDITNSTYGYRYVNITWQAPSLEGGFPILGYAVYRGTSPDDLKYQNFIDNRMYKIDGTVELGNTYYYAVGARNIFGEGPLSEPVKVTPISTPFVPEYLELSSGDSFVNLNWIEPVEDGGSPITNYMIYRSDNNDEPWLYKEIGNALFFNDTEVVNGVSYSYRVSAKNVEGESPLSIKLSATPLAKPKVPLNFTSTMIDLYILLTWDKPESDGGAGITSYFVYKSESSTELGSIVYAASATSYQDISLTAGVTYYYRVSAFNMVGESPLSEQLEIAFLTVPSEPMEMKAVAGDSYIHLTWNVPETDGGATITDYLLYRDTNSEVETLYRELGTALEFNDTNVNIEDTYYYRVSAKNAVGEGPSSNEVSAGLSSTPQIELPAPTGLKAQAGDSFVYLTWDAPEVEDELLITGYNIYRGTDPEEINLDSEIDEILFCNDTKVTNGVTYYYKVSAVYNAGEGELSKLWMKQL